jgi:enoyl-CoA hydratase/carnithine racemase
MIISFAKEGMLVPNKGKDTEKLPPEWQKIKALFADKNIDAWLNSKYLNSNDPLEAKIAGIIAEKAPIAVRLANKIIDVGYKKSLKAGMKEELKHLHEIFSTKDALTGLSNVGKKVQFEGK